MIFEVPIGEYFSFHASDYIIIPWVLYKDQAFWLMVREGRGRDPLQYITRLRPSQVTLQGKSLFIVCDILLDTLRYNRVLGTSWDKEYYSKVTYYE